jgi:uncharacterized protein
MTWQMIRLADMAPAPWKNGGGTTRELIAWPEAGDWQWRTSVAVVSNDGPFSSFAGVQRWFAVLQGDGVCLAVDDQLHLLKAGDPPLQFNGAARTTCTLLGGATQDFNLMVKEGFSARMHWIDDDQQLTLKTPKIIALYANNTTATLLFGSKEFVCPAHCLMWSRVDTKRPLTLHASNALLMEIDL